jgi:large subunit ribosomal protein L13
MKRLGTHETKGSEIVRKWYLVDANEKNLGRLACKVAKILMGKGKVTWTDHLDSGDYVVLINAAKIVVTGKKETQKLYFRHSGYPGGDKLFNFKKLIDTKPERIIRQAVWGMLPQNRLGRVMLKKLKIYSGADHGNLSQKPEMIEL